MASSPASSSDTVITTDNVSLVHVHMTNVTKLTDSNFLMWSRQVRALLNGYDLTGYIDDTITVPLPTTTVANVVTANPAYKQWQRQD